MSYQSLRYVFEDLLRGPPALQLPERVGSLPYLPVRALTGGDVNECGKAFHSWVFHCHRHGRDALMLRVCAKEPGLGL